MRLSLASSSLAVIAVALGVAGLPPITAAASGAAGVGPAQAGAATGAVGVVLVPFEDQSGSGAPAGIGDWLARGLQQRLAGDATLVPRLLSPLPSGNGTTVPGLMEIGRERRSSWVLRGGLLSLNAGGDPSRKATSVSLFAELVRVETGALRTVRAEGHDARLDGEHPWASFDAAPGSSRSSPIGRAIENALDALATAVREPIALAGTDGGADSGGEGPAAGDGSEEASADAAEEGPAAADGSDQVLAADEELQQLLSGAEAALEADGGAHPGAVRSVQQSLAALQAALQQDAERLEGGGDPEPGAATLDARRAELEQAVQGLVEAGESGDSEGTGGDVADTNERRGAIEQAQGFVQQTLELVIKIQELRAAFQGFDEERSAAASGEGASAAEGEGEGVSDADGEGDGEARASAAGEASGTESSDDADLGELEGVVMEDGHPVAGAEVVDEASGSRSVSAANGHFTLGNLPVGSMASLKLFRAGRTIGAGRVDVPRSRAGVVDFEIGARPGSGAAGGVAASALRVLPSNIVVNSRATMASGSSTVRGEVRDPNGKPVPRALVRIGDLAAARTDSRGAYRFLRVPAGDHRLVVDAPGMNTHAETIRAAAHGDRLVAIRLAASPAARHLLMKKASIVLATSARLSGRVRDGQGQPVGGARVSVVPSSGSGRAFGRRTDQTGRYRFSLSPGSYRVLVAKSGYRTGREDVALAVRADRACDITLHDSDTRLTRAVASRAKRMSKQGAHHGPGVGRGTAYRDSNTRGVASGGSSMLRGFARGGEHADARRETHGRPSTSSHVTSRDASKREPSTFARAFAGLSARKDVSARNKGQERGRAERATGHDLGSGRHCSVTGVAQDTRSRPVEGAITVSRHGTSIGQAHTTGGRFGLFDLEPGRYVLRFAALGGGVATKSITVGGGPAQSVRLVLQR